MHRLRCCDGNSENNEIQKSHSVLTSTGNDRNIDAIFSKVYKLKCSMLSYIYICTYFI